MKLMTTIVTFAVIFGGLKCSNPTMAEADFDDMPLAFTEVMYRFSEQDTLEYVEIRNVCDVDVELRGIRIIGGIDYQFPSEVSVLCPGEYVVVTNAVDDFSVRYPNSRCLGPFDGRLSNEGESIKLVSPYGTRITEMSWDENFPWPVLADGKGYSLVSVDPSPITKQDYVDAWRNSSAVGGSPGFTDPAFDKSDVIINEYKPAESELQGFVELYNRSSKNVDIGGWIIADGKDFSTGYTIPDQTVIKPGSFYLVSTENGEVDFGNREQCLYLVSANRGELTGYGDGFLTWGVLSGQSVGILPEGHVGLLSKATPGKKNAETHCSQQVIITEVMYHPADDGFEFMELQNVGDTAVTVGMTSLMPFCWKIGGIDFTFPENAALSAGEILLLVNRNDSTLLQEHYTGDSLRVFFYSGKLSNKGERVCVLKPVESYVTEDGIHEPVYSAIDQIVYDDRSPWPVEADGDGYSLVREEAGCGGSHQYWRRSESKGGNPGVVQ